MDTFFQILFSELLPLFLLILIIFFPLFYLENKIFKRLKNKHPDFYEKIGRPNIWGPSLPHWHLFFWGAYKLPQDLEIKKLLKYFWLLLVVDIIIIVFYFSVTQ